MTASLGAGEAISLAEKLVGVLNRRKKYYGTMELFDRATIEQKQNLNLQARMMGQVSTKYIERIADLSLSIIGTKPLEHINELQKVAAMLHDSRYTSMMKSLFQNNYVPIATTLINELEERKRSYSKLKWWILWHKL